MTHARHAFNARTVSAGKSTATTSQKPVMLAESQGLGGVETLLRNPDGSLHLRIIGTPSAFTRTLTGAEKSGAPQDIAISRATAIAWGKRHQCWEGR